MLMLLPISHAGQVVEQAGCFVYFIQARCIHGIVVGGAGETQQVEFFNYVKCFYLRYFALNKLLSVQVSMGAKGMGSADSSG